MPILTAKLSQYAAYHRDVRNIATHFIGIPMIVLAVLTLLARPLDITIGGLELTVALVIYWVSSLYYLYLDRRFGLAMMLIHGLMLWVANQIASLPLQLWLSWGIGLFIVGWIIQFIGHIWEGRKPAFFDDVIGLIIGPLFVVAEAAFLLGWCKALQVEIEAIVGPTRRRQ